MNDQPTSTTEGAAWAVVTEIRKNLATYEVKVRADGVGQETDWLRYGKEGAVYIAPQIGHQVYRLDGCPRVYPLLGITALEPPI